MKGGQRCLGEVLAERGEHRLGVVGSGADLQRVVNYCKKKQGVWGSDALLW